MSPDRADDVAVTVRHRLSGAMTISATTLKDAMLRDSIRPTMLLVEQCLDATRGLTDSVPTRDRGEIVFSGEGRRSQKS